MEGKNSFLIEISDFHHSFYEEAPRVPVENYAEEKEKYDLKDKEWKRSNNCSLLMMKDTISFDIKNAIPDSVYLLKRSNPLKMGFKGFCYEDNKAIEDILFIYMHILSS